MSASLTDPPVIANIPRQRTTAPAHAATLEHSLLIRRKIVSLTETLAESMAQLFTVAEREYRSGRLTLDDLATLYEQAREFGPGFSSVWNEHISVTPGAIRDYARRQPATGGLYWAGPYPYDNSRRPLKGTAVVYVLYDATNEPIYVGSSGNFNARMRAHRSTGKPIAWWLAYPCASREAAYLLEGGLLAARKPPMNVKAGR